ncbi:MAG: 23S rRNA (guanosine(2251)-2'-O)-methyltransferase RlmB [Christensenellales bacterium]|jgi:23S rRNA (guanosine2251-2'-O)-methyltransferase
MNLETNETNTQLNVLMGRNPIREAIKKGRSIDRLLVAEGNTDGSVKEIVKLARDRRVVVVEVSRNKLDELCMPYGYGGRPGNHQGMVAILPAKEYCSVEDIFQDAKEKGQPLFLILLDGIQDPHNLGAILRSAEALGAHGVVLPKRRSAPLNAAAAKASAGAIEYVKVAQVANLPALIQELKGQGVWVVGASMDGQAAYEADLSGPLALVVGSEGEGLSRLVKERCDFLVSVPLVGKMESYNASVAAGILMYEKYRQSRGK